MGIWLQKLSDICITFLDISRGRNPPPFLVVYIFSYHGQNRVKNLFFHVLFDVQKVFQRNYEHCLAFILVEVTHPLHKPRPVAHPLTSRLGTPSYRYPEGVCNVAHPLILVEVVHPLHKPRPVAHPLIYWLCTPSYRYPEGVRKVAHPLISLKLRTPS